jgi:hypothetical protein
MRSTSRLSSTLTEMDEEGGTARSFFFVREDGPFISCSMKEGEGREMREDTSCLCAIGRPEIKLHIIKNLALLCFSPTLPSGVENNLLFAFSFLFSFLVFSFLTAPPFLHCCHHCCTSLFSSLLLPGDDRGRRGGQLFTLFLSSFDRPIGLTIRYCLVSLPLPVVLN